MWPVTIPSSYTWVAEETWYRTSCKAQAKQLSKPILSHATNKKQWWPSTSLQWKPRPYTRISDTTRTSTNNRTTAEITVVSPSTNSQRDIIQQIHWSIQWTHAHAPVLAPAPIPAPPAPAPIPLFIYFNLWSLNLFQGSRDSNVTHSVNLVKFPRILYLA